MTIKDRIVSTLFHQRAITSELDTLVKAYTQQGKFSGAVLVARDEQILLSKGYGMANLDYDIANTPQTAFRIGSLTKTFSAVALMQHIEAGHITVHDTLSRFVPDFPNGERITIHHLLSNTSGIPDYVVMPAYEKLMKHNVPIDELLTLFRDEPLQFEPGTGFTYSNSNWVLLGLILEQLDGKPYAQVIQERIFQPANMPGAGYDWDQAVIKGRAVGYFSDGERLLQAEVVHEATMHAAGGLYMTVEDLFAFDQALDNERLLRSETLTRMTEEIQPGYAYGWELHTLYNTPTISHSGGIPGFVSNFVRLGDAGTIVILSNLEAPLTLR
jgi:CubicO group peptidase (beta-lactamase class C family)